MGNAAESSLPRHGLARAGVANGMLPPGSADDKEPHYLAVQPEAMGGAVERRVALRQAEVGLVDERLCGVVCSLATT